MDGEEFREKLNPEQYRVMRERGTEVAHTGKYYNFDEQGAYLCAACGRIVFFSFNKKKSNDGYPAFTRPASKSSVIETKDSAGIEVACKKCSSHLGYRLEDTYYQINSIALDFQELPDIEFDKGVDEERNKSSQPAPKTNTWALTIGGITIGVALGAGAMYAVSPQDPLACVPSEQQQTAQVPAPADNSGASVNAPAGTAAGGAPRGNSEVLKEPSAILATPPSTSTSSAGSASSADGADSSADGTI